MMRTAILAVTLLLATALNIEPVLAQVAGLPILHSTVSDSALAGSAGNIAVNISAGSASAQANIAAISIGAEFAKADISSHQRVDGNFPLASSNEFAEIGNNAFQQAAGIIAINQSSGNGNAQANLVAIAVGKMTEISTDQLAGVSVWQNQPASSTGNAEHSGKQKSIIADSAFAGARGIVQVNQLAGSGNTSANVFALSLGVGAQ